MDSHNTKLEKVSEDTYVGDQISEDGKLDKTVTARYSKAVGITSEIMNMLKEISVGHHFFEMGIIFRNLKFINAVLTNAEVWHPITENQLEKFKKADF